MVVVYRNVPCSLCGGHHDLWMETARGGITYKPHDFICPETHQRTFWRPNVFAHLTDRVPEGAIHLIASENDEPAHA